MQLSWLLTYVIYPLALTLNSKKWAIQLWHPNSATASYSIKFKVYKENFASYSFSSSIQVDRTSLVKLPKL